MKIIAHRGMWFNKHEQNTLVAFERALENGFGIETDFRDFNGSLVISHDLPLENVN
jgi:glycerophosphoryl diester phosphodiesterase